MGNFCWGVHCTNVPSELTKSDQVGTFFSEFVNSLGTFKKRTSLVTLISGVFLDSSGDQPFVGKLIFHGLVTPP